MPAFRRLPVLLAVAGLLAVAVASWLLRPGAPAVAPGTPASPYDAHGRAVGEVPRPARLPNLVVILVDTLRADAVAPGPHGPGMPFLARLAAEGVSFEQASSPAPWTMPSLASLLTGLLPSGHGNLDSRRPPALPPAVTTFAEVLYRTYGYETVACTDGPWLGGRQEMLQGFQRVIGDFHFQGMDDLLQGWAQGRDRSKPVFLVLHTYEAHHPYGAENHPWPPHGPGGWPPATLPDRVLAPWELARAFFLEPSLAAALTKARGREWVVEAVRYITDGYAKEPRPELARELAAAYAEGTTWVDGLLQKSVDRLREWGLLENTLLVVTGDHGESFGEHGMLGHARQLYDEMLRVPLVLHGPAPFQGGKVVSGGVGLIDVLPTFFAWAGIPPPAPLDARSALPLLTAGSAGWPVVAEEVLSHDNTGRDVEATLSSVRTTRWKYLVTYDRGAGTIVEEIYDLAADPGEKNNLWAKGHVSLDLGAEMCGAIRSVRDRIWGAAHVDELRAGTPYGAGVGTVQVPEPPPCD